MANIIELGTLTMFMSLRVMLVVDPLFCWCLDGEVESAFLLLTLFKGSGVEAVTSSCDMEADKTLTA